eukprot:Hpha_TRINITY_DN16696_c1_g1::TRINITY_DN16696_c1_g1_i1::g.179550::m.179550/K08857/NEK1_4_5; NIMA (never in mitosis gene a)-related kinase 1/4/5
MERFTKVRNIGKGNMGACYLMKNNDDQRYYVIKQIDLGKMSKKERQQALNEARVLSALKHPNIINYVDSFLAKRTDHLCIVMEYAEGGDIAQRIKACRGRHLREEQILDWFIQTCLATNAIHAKHILHRDIKTQNVFLTSSNVAKIGDFGIARVLQNTFDQANTFVGTPYYLSPELVQEKPYDARSDAWALGVVLYEMMALRHPFNAGDMKSLMTKIIRVQYDLPPSFYTQDMRDVVIRTLVRDPRHRMSLQDMISSPVVQRRTSQWVCGNSGVSQSYVQTMLQHRLLPGYTHVQAPGRQHSDGVPESARQEGSHLPILDRHTSDLRSGMGEDLHRGEERERHRHREEVRREYAELRREPSVPSMQPRREREHQVESLYEGFGRKNSDPRAGDYRHAPPERRQSDDYRFDAQRQRELQKERELQGIVADRGAAARHPHLSKLGQHGGGGAVQRMQQPSHHHHQQQHHHHGQQNHHHHHGHHHHHQPRPVHLPRMPGGMGGQAQGHSPHQHHQLLQHQHPSAVRQPPPPVRLPQPGQLGRLPPQHGLPGVGGGAPHPPSGMGGLPPVPRPQRPLPVSGLR